MKIEIQITENHLITMTFTPLDLDGLMKIPKSVTRKLNFLNEMNLDWIQSFCHGHQFYQYKYIRIFQNDFSVQSKWIYLEFYKLSHAKRLF